jgi:hypothetical protein
MRNAPVRLQQLVNELGLMSSMLFSCNYRGERLHQSLNNRSRLLLFFSRYNIVVWPSRMRRAAECEFLSCNVGFPRKVDPLAE